MQEMPWFILTLLLTMAFVSLVITVFVPKQKYSLILMGLSFFGYFALTMILGDQGAVPSLFFILGIILLFVELFVPGFGLPGIAGLFLIALASSMAARSLAMAVIMVGIALLISLITIWILIRMGYNKTIFHELALETQLTGEEGFHSASNQSCYLGKEGITETILRPSGIIRIGEERLDVVTRGEFIPKGEIVEIIRIEGGKKLVRRK